MPLDGGDVDAILDDVSARRLVGAEGERVARFVHEAPRSPAAFRRLTEAFALVREMPSQSAKPRVSRRLGLPSLVGRLPFCRNRRPGWFVG